MNGLKTMVVASLFSIFSGCSDNLGTFEGSDDFRATRNIQYARIKLDENKNFVSKRISKDEFNRLNDSINSETILTVKKAFAWEKIADKLKIQEAVRDALSKTRGRRGR